MRRDQFVFCPLTRQAASDFCRQFHLYLSGSVHGHVFSFGALLRLRLVGAIMLGRPTNQFLDDGYTLQGYRLATSDHFPNLGSMMVGRAVKIARLLGYRRVIAYCQVDYPAVQIRAAGFSLECDHVRGRGQKVLRRYSVKF